MFGDELEFQDRLTEWVDAAVPVPVADSVVVEGWALLVKVRIALSAPATCGLNVNVNGTLCPDGMLTGSDKPLMVNRELFEVAAVTVTLVPLALRAPEAVPLLPMTTSPADNVAGVAVSCAVVDVPDVPDVPDAAALAELNPWQPTVAPRQRRTSPRFTTQRLSA
jgi:hypothetical protein